MVFNRTALANFNMYIHFIQGRSGSYIAGGANLKIFRQKQHFSDGFFGNQSDWGVPGKNRIMPPRLA